MTDRTDADNVGLLAGARDGIERMVAQGVLTDRVHLSTMHGSARAEPEPGAGHRGAWPPRQEAIVSATNGYRTTGHTAVLGTRPVMLLRYRPGVVGETVRTVHLVALPQGETGAAGVALCGALLRPNRKRSVIP